jgi:CheY-like chemotaxis protein
VLTAAGGAEALAICAQRSPRMVLMDQHVAGMGAAELARLLRQSRGDQAPPVVVLVTDIIDPTELGEVAAAIPKDLADDKLESLLAKLAPH